MVRIAPVDLQLNPKTLWFDAGDLEIEVGSAVVVTTARGTEFGHLADEVFEASEAQINALKTPLKPVERIATPEDETQAEEMAHLSQEALPVFKEMAAQCSSDMRPVSVEYLLDGDKAIFYFESDDRIDFRELVRKLASHFHVRVDMRQIGVRDEARMVGGLGHCGQELCCKRLGGEFCPVSIRMAKEQDLSLNPQKISGVCGRLMCCLRYEFDAYKDFKSRAPKLGATISTPDGDAKVVNLDVPREIVSLKLEEEKPVKVPLADFDEPEEGQTRPKSIGQDAWDKATAEDSFDALGSVVAGFNTQQLTGRDKLAQPTAVRRTGGKSTQAQKQKQAAEQPTRVPRRRRSTKIDAEGHVSVQSDAKAGKGNNKATSKAGKQSASHARGQAGPQKQNASAKQGRSRVVRGQAGGSQAVRNQAHSSQAARNQASSSQTARSQAANKQANNKQAASQANKNSRQRRNSQAKSTRKPRSNAQRTNEARTSSQAQTTSAPQAQGTVRPGQNSSGLQQAHRRSRKRSSRVSSSNASGNAKE